MTETQKLIRLIWENLRMCDECFGKGFQTPREYYGTGRRWLTCSNCRGDGLVLHGIQRVHEQLEKAEREEE